MIRLSLSLLYDHYLIRWSSINRAYKQCDVLLKSTLLVLCSALIACSHAPPKTYSPETQVYVAQHHDSPLWLKYAPKVIAQGTQHDYNKIGTPRLIAEREGEATAIAAIVDTHEAAYFVETRQFETGNGAYTNLVYRMHFPAVPLKHLTAGGNVGLLIVVTLDALQRPVLYTTVHTCGCYIAFFPTNYMPVSALPKHWPEHEQRVFGRRLPTLVDMGAFDAMRLPYFVLKAGSHRVVDVKVIDQSALEQIPHVPVMLKPMDALRSLPFESEQLSFFYEQGWRKHYVRDSVKPWELLLMSWWVMDLWVTLISQSIGCSRISWPESV